MLKSPFSRKTNPAEALYGAIVAAARQPGFYRDWAVPDTVDGRFEMIVLHMYLVLDRLKPEPEPLRQALTDLFFTDMDRSLREMGVGDLGVGKKVRKMAEAFFGRIAAYAGSNDVESLTDSLARNAYAGNAGGHEASARMLALWTFNAKQKLQSQNAENIVNGRITFA